MPGAASPVPVVGATGTVGPHVVRALAERQVPIGGAGISFIDARDVGACAAAAR
jgi:aspartate-semialdehyde dehydrogenase